MAERLQQSPLLAGDAIDIAFTIGHNDHPDFGGLELTLRDFKVPPPEALEGIRRGHEDVKAERTRPAADFLSEMRQKHDISR